MKIRIVHILLFFFLFNCSSTKEVGVELTKQEKIIYYESGEILTKGKLSKNDIHF